MKRTLIGFLGVSALALLFSVTPVMAASVDVTGENMRTGSESDNENTYDIDHDIDVDVDNDSEVDNQADADTDTGDNEQNDNTTAGDLTSGGVDASTDWETVIDASAALAGVSDDGLTVSGDFTNDTTGSDSDNENDLDADHDVDVDLDNVADVFNDLDLDADTGDNEQNDNTIAGSLETGAVGVDSIVSNWVGSGGDVFAALPSTTVDVTANNHITGSDSDNTNEFDIDNDYDLDIDNDVEIDNQFDIDADTGDNEQNDNTTAGNLETGNVDVTTDVENVVGAAMAASGAPSLAITADFANDTTGSDSDNENSLDVDNDVDIDIDNDVELDNELDVDANTGDNEQNDNTLGGDVKTGSVKINFGVSNHVN